MKGENLVLMVGCGDLGIRCGRLLLADGREVAGIRRNPGSLPGDFGAFTADYTGAASLDFIEALEPACVLASFNPTARSVEGYRDGFVVAMANLLRGLGRHRNPLRLHAGNRRDHHRDQFGLGLRLGRLRLSPCAGAHPSKPRVASSTARVVPW